MITTDIPPVHRPASLKKFTRQGTDSSQGTSITIKAAHPLFPPDQAFLWLPGLPGEQAAYCTYNETGNSGPAEQRRILRRPERDQNQALYAPPHRVSPESFIAWHINVTPPFPFHPVPIARTLSAAELTELGRRAHGIANPHTALDGDPLKILRNDRKCFVLAVLAEMGLLAGRVSRPF